MTLTTQLVDATPVWKEWTFL